MKRPLSPISVRDSCVFELEPLFFCTGQSAVQVSVVIDICFQELAMETQYRVNLANKASLFLSISARRCRKTLKPIIAPTFFQTTPSNSVLIQQQTVLPSYQKEVLNYQINSGSDFIQSARRKHHMVYVHLFQSGQLSEVYQELNNFTGGCIMNNHTQNSCQLDSDYSITKKKKKQVDTKSQA